MPQNDQLLKYNPSVINTIGIATICMLYWLTFHLITLSCFRVLPCQLLFFVVFNAYSLNDSQKVFFLQKNLLYPLLTGTQLK